MRDKYQCICRPTPTHEWLGSGWVCLHVLYSSVSKLGCTLGSVVVSYTIAKKYKLWLRDLSGCIIQKFRSLQTYFKTIKEPTKTIKVPSVGTLRIHTREKRNPSLRRTKTMMVGRDRFPSLTLRAVDFFLGFWGHTLPFKHIKGPSCHFFRFTCVEDFVVKAVTRFIVVDNDLGRCVFINKTVWLLEITSYFVPIM